MVFTDRRAGLEGPDQHIDAIRRFKEAVSGWTIPPSFLICAVVR